MNQTVLHLTKHFFTISTRPCNASSVPSVEQDAWQETLLFCTWSFASDLKDDTV